MRERILRGVLPLLLLAVAACREARLEALRRDPAVLALVGRFRVQRPDLEAASRYRQAGEGNDPGLMSRIFDGLLEEVLVLNDAVAGPPPALPEPLGPYADPARREAAVAAVLQQKVYSKVRIRDEEVAAYYRDHLREFERGPGILFREILLSGEAQAREARALLRGGHSFEDVARLYSLSPERGAPQYFTYEELPDYLREFLRRAPPGVPTEPLRASADTLQIFLVERRLLHYTLPLEEVAPQIRLSLSDAEGERLYNEYVGTLRRRFPPEVFWDKLPFAYRKETP
ncbi:MAG: peptidylprolyl isomerase [Acidobacteriota bacterium]